VLRFLHFRIAVDHPYRYLFNYCASLRCGPRLTQLAVCAVNDCLLQTDICAGTAPEVVAAGAGPDPCSPSHQAGLDDIMIAAG